jgi:hypothetical protein
MRITQRFPEAAYFSSASCVACLHATGNSIENGYFCLLYCGNGVVDRKARFPLKSIGLAFRASSVPIMLFLSNVGF